MTETNYAVAPGEFLQEWMEDNPASKQEIADRLDTSPAVVYAILSGSIPVSPPMAEKLAELTAIPAKTWLSIQELYEEDLGRLGIIRLDQN